MRTSATVGAATQVTYPMAKARFIHPIRFVICCMLAVLSLSGVSRANLVGFDPLYRFPRFGMKPQGIVRGPDNNFYGVTKGGGLNWYGTLYCISEDTGEVTTLANFGYWLTGPSEYIVVDQGGNIFGLCGSTIWRWNLNGGLTIVGSLSGVASGEIEGGLLMDGDGGLIGTAQSGGANGAGVLWRWHPTTGAQRLGEFEEAKTGLRTKAPLARDSDGAIYGCSLQQYNEMILWRWKPVTGFEKLASLPWELVGSAERGLSVDGNKTVWGATAGGGANRDGTLWRWSQTGGVEKLGDFGPDVSGQEPSGPLTLGLDGYPIGISTMAIWKWTPQTGLVRLSDASFSKVGAPFGAIAQDNFGAIHGASISGGPGGCVWKWSASTGSVVLQQFDAQTYIDRDDGVVRDAQGRIYGRSNFSTPSYHTVFWRWSDSRAYEVLANAAPGWLNADPAGNIYGVNSATSGYPGGLWRWSESEGWVQLAVFNFATEGSPAGTLLFGDQGQIYGTSTDNQNSWIWKWTAETGITRIETFNNASVGFARNQVRGTNGEWYGTRYPEHVLFSWSETGGVVNLFDFDDAATGSSHGVFANDAAGNIYGTMVDASTKLWRWNATSGFTVLATFDANTTGDQPRSLLVSAKGEIRGICAAGGAYDHGTIWNWSEAGGLCPIHHFHPQNIGSIFEGNVVEDSAGNLCGVGNGLLWRYIFRPPEYGPSVTTGSLVMQDDNAWFTGTVNPNGNPTMASLWCGETPDDLLLVSQVSGGSGWVPHLITSSISGLPQRRRIFARFTANNFQGASSGDLVTFFTPNHPPTAVSDHIHSPPIASSPFVVDVLANDTDGDDALILHSASDAGGVGLSTIVDNKIHFVPNQYFTGNAIIRYEVKDEFGATADSLLYIDNVPAHANDDVVMRGDGDVAFNPLTNDVDPDGDELSIIEVTQGSQGTVTFSATQIVYSPKPDYLGPDSFSYTITDHRGSKSTARVTVRPGQVLYREVLQVGRVLPSCQGDFVVKKIASAGSLGEGQLLVQTENAEEPGTAIVNMSDLSIALRTGQELALPNEQGSVRIDSIEEISGRAVFVKLMKTPGRKKLTRGIVFLDRQRGAQLVMYEGGYVTQNDKITTITRFCGSANRAFILAKMQFFGGKKGQALYRWEDELRTKLRATGTPLEIEPVNSISTLVPAAGSPAYNRWTDGDGRLLVRLGWKGGKQEIVIFTEGVAPSWLTDTAKRPSEPRFLEFGLPAFVSAFGSFDRAVFRATQMNEGSKVSGIFAQDNNRLHQPLVRKGEEVMGEPKAVVSSLSDPVAGDPGNVAFLSDITTGSRKRRALCWSRNSEMRVVVSEGDLLPGSTAERFGRINSFVLPRGRTGGPVFTATTAKGLGLWSVNASGELVPVAKPGMKLTFDGVERTVTSVRALEGAKAPAIDSRGFDSSGRAEALVKFSDGTESLIQFALP